MSHEEGIQKAVEYISKKNRYAIFMGDGIEAITYDDTRFDPQDKISLPEQERKALKKYIRPIRNKHLCWLIGNHEWKVLKYGNMALSICEDFGIDYGTWSAKLSIYDDHGLMYRIFVTHGDGSINSKVRDALRRKTTMKENLKGKLFLLSGDCHVQAMGHTHKLLVYSPKEQNGLFLTGESKLSQHYELPEPPKEGFIHPDSRWYLNTGSFLKLYGGEEVIPQSGYAERKMLAPVELGFLSIKVRNGKIIGVEEITV